MTTLTKELEQRLKKLEIEQENQDIALNDVGNLEEEIRELEAILAKIDSYTLELADPETDYSQLRDLKEIEKLEQKLAHIDEEFEQNASLVDKGKKNQSNTPRLVPQPSSKNTTAVKKPQSTPLQARVTSSYVICLMFNPKSPPEWSGKGWCEQGKGMRYTNPAQAKQILQKLKQQWPDYPLKIFKR